MIPDNLQNAIGAALSALKIAGSEGSPRPPEAKAEGPEIQVPPPSAGERRPDPFG